MVLFFVFVNGLKKKGKLVVGVWNSGSASLRVFMDAL